MTARKVNTVVAIGVSGNDALRHLNEQGPFPFSEIFKRGAMGRAGRCLDLGQQGSTGHRQFAKPRAAVNRIYRSLDEAAACKPLERASRRRSIECNVDRQRRLVRGFARRECREETVLQRGNVKPSASLLK
jgi:hypothetical protein